MVLFYVNYFLRLLPRRGWALPNMIWRDSSLWLENVSHPPAFTFASRAISCFWTQSIPWSLLYHCRRRRRRRPLPNKCWCRCSLTDS